MLLLLYYRRQHQHALRQYNEIDDGLKLARLAALESRLSDWEAKNLTENIGSQGLWPLEEESYITSPYGRRKDPFLEDGVPELLLYGGRLYGSHTGVDISSPAYHAELRCPVDGVVVEHYVPPQRGTRWKGHKVLGGAISILDDEGRVWTFGHLSTTYIHEGYRVHAGDVIARLGSTGKSTGEHLHLEVKLSNGFRVNPLRCLEYREITPRGWVIGELIE